MIRCTRCNRKLKEARPSGLGATCEMYVLGPRPKASTQSTHRPNVSRDRFTVDMFAEVRHG